MKRNPSMTEEDWRWFELSLEAPKLAPAEIERLEKRLRADPSDMDVRVQLFAYYNKYKGNELKHKNADEKLSKLVLWLVENKPRLTGSLGHRLAMTGNCFKPKSFAMIREAWLQQVSTTPMDATVLGNAASFVVWNDFETASNLFEQAYALEPSKGWLGTFVLHCNSQLWSTPFLYKDEIRERIIDVGARSLTSESSGAPFLTCQYVSDAALDLERYELVRWCAEILRNWGVPVFEQMANAYLGLVALRENRRDLARQLMLEMKRGYQPQEIVFRLAKELFELGERESIVQLVRSFKGKIKASVRKHWLEQIENNEIPDFEDYCS
jgi:tetratricopeptide (TPR) repeat protein